MIILIITNSTPSCSFLHWRDSKWDSKKCWLWNSPISKNPMMFINIVRSLQMWYFTVFSFHTVRIDHIWSDFALSWDVYISEISLIWSSWNIIVIVTSSLLIFAVCLQCEESVEPVPEGGTRPDRTGVRQSSRSLVTYQASSAHTESIQRGETKFSATLIFR